MAAFLFMSHPRLILEICRLILPATLAVSASAASSPINATSGDLPDWTDIALPREEIDATQNALVRWWELFPRIQPAEEGVSSLLMEQISPLRPSIPDTNDVALAWLDSARGTLADMAVRDGERLQFRRIEGPDTPFPDHAPLHWVAVTRANLVKRVWTAGDRKEAIALACANLAYARAFLLTQEGVVPMIKGSGIWQVALDGAYWLARQPLAPDEAAVLQAELAQDSQLARQAIERGFRGEFTFFYKNVLERMPVTRDPDLLLGSLASLAMHPPQPLEEGEQYLATPLPPPAGREPLDRDATLRAGAADIRGYIQELARLNGRFPRGFVLKHTLEPLEQWRKELRGFYTYATDEGPFLPEVLAEANAAVLHSDNPVGRLFLILNTPQWEPLMISILRREAQRAALTGLLAWRRNGAPDTWDSLVQRGLLAAAPIDPFGEGEALRFDLSAPRIWSLGIDGVDQGGYGNGENIGQPDDLVWPW